MRLSVALAIGKLHEPSAVPKLMKVADDGGDLALHSTVVHALGLIGGHPAINALAKISRTHPSALVRQAEETLASLPH